MTIAGSSMVIIGGSSGIGLATAHAAVLQGAKVSIGGRNQATLKAAAEICGAEAALTVDATDEKSLATFYHAVGDFDHLIIAASGGSGAGQLVDLDCQVLRTGFETKFFAHWKSAKAALPFLSSRGSITFVTAASARTSNSGTSGLAAINGAINAMVGPLSRELAPVRVNAVAPGVVDTPWWDRQKPEVKAVFFESSARSLPVGRVGAPNDIAEALLFLAGNSFTTGVILDVDGGLRSANSE